ncbi:PPOX class F420-dependent oxidoreductase [Nocardia sp. NBC_01327]|uniref:PPOX class F420-dependent oxidoreductase n=1 Tax=Nocardia sp. NBC_01327 TaxID=2903593 RepID=UPI002E155485|nr:PPOX class F420-dependent oxidoreductase [Nocardia sp. NBC_01327]
MTPQLETLARDLIDGPHSAILSTSDSEGRPQSSVIFVIYDDDSIVFSTIKGRLKTRNMNRNPWVSLLILSKTSSQYVNIRGKVDITEDRENFHDVVYGRYMDGATPPPEPEAERLIVRITPDRIYAFPPA